MWFESPPSYLFRSLSEKHTQIKSALLSLLKQILSVRVLSPHSLVTFAKNSNSNQTIYFEWPKERVQMPCKNEATWGWSEPTWHQHVAIATANPADARFWEKIKFILTYLSSGLVDRRTESDGHEPIITVDKHGCAQKKGAIASSPLWEWYLIYCHRPMQDTVLVIS